MFGAAPSNTSQPMIPLPLCTSTESAPFVGFPVLEVKLSVPVPTPAFAQNCQLSTVVSNGQTLIELETLAQSGGGPASAPPVLDAPPVPAAPPADVPPPPALA